MDAALKAMEEGEIDAIAYDRPILQTIANTDSLRRFRVLNVKYNPQFYAIGMNRALPDSLKYRINLALLSTIEEMDWKILLSEYDLK